jgi:hypothetical protein
MPDVVSFFPPGHRIVEILPEQSPAAGAVFGAQGPGRRQDGPMRAMQNPSGAETRSRTLTPGGARGVYIGCVREFKMEIPVASLFE